MSPLDKLSPRKRQVARLVAEGFTNKQIAETLGLSVGTIKVYISQIYDQLNIIGRATLMRMYIVHLESPIGNVNISENEYKYEVST